MGTVICAASHDSLAGETPKLKATCFSVDDAGLERVFSSNTKGVASLSGGSPSVSSDWSSPKRPTGDTSAPDGCDIWEKTTLSSPVPAVVKQLKIGDILEIELYNGNQLLVLFGGQKAGAITSPKMMLFVDCIANKGAVFQARVLGLNSGQVDLKVYRF